MFSRIHNPVCDMPILHSSNSKANKDMSKKVQMWIQLSD